MAKKIPEGSVEIQKGLWLYEYKKTISGVEYTFRQLFSSEGYCFYDKEEDQYDENGKLLPRTYAQWMSLSALDNSKSIEELNAQYISVVIEDGMFILSNPQKPEIA